MKATCQSYIGSFRVSKHASERMHQRRINHRHIERALNEGRSIYLQGREFIYYGALKLILVRGSEVIVTAMWTKKTPPLKLKPLHIYTKETK